MAAIKKILDNGEVIYPITKPECVIDENGKNVLQLIEENGGGKGLQYSEERTAYITKINNFDDFEETFEITEEQREYNKETVRLASEKDVTLNMGGGLLYPFITGGSAAKFVGVVGDETEVWSLSLYIDDEGNATASYRVIPTSGEGSYDDTEIRQEIANLSETKAEKSLVETIYNEVNTTLERVGQGMQEALQGFSEQLSNQETELTELSAEVGRVSDRINELGQPIFEAKYGVTTYDEIVAAKNDGKWVILIKDNLTYHLSYVTDTLAYFATINNNNSYSVYINKATNGWVEGIRALEQTSNKTTALSSASTDTQYPSAKAVYAEVSGIKDSLEPLKLESFSYDFTSENLIPGAVDNVGAIVTYGKRTEPIEFKKGDILTCKGFFGTPSYSLVSEWSEGKYVRSLFVPNAGDNYDFTLEIDKNMSIVFSTGSSAISISGSRSLAIANMASAGKQWKKVFEGRMAVGESKISASTFADGTPLLAEEVVVQILMDSFEGVSVNKQGYVGIRSSTNPTIGLYGALYFEKIGGTIPLLSMMRLKASPFIMVGEMTDCSPIAVAQGMQFSARVGKTAEVYEDICYVEVGPTLAIAAAPPLIKIYAR